MSQDISLSLEETNKLRLKLGLKPIPITKNESEKQIEPTPSSNNIIELSIEETNKLRKSLGLQPIPTEPTESNYQSIQSQNSNQDNDLSKRIAKAKVSSTKRKLMEIQSDEEELDTDNWLNNLGKEHSTKKQKIETKNTDNHDEVNAKINHNLEELNTLKNNDILTLQDSNILDDEEGEDLLTNEKLTQALKVKNKLKEKKAADMLKFNGRRYQPDDDEVEDSDSINGISIKNSTIKLNSARKPSREEESKPKNVTKFTDIFENKKDDESATEWSQPEPIKFKKFKKKKPLDNSKSRTTRIKDDDLNPLEEIDLNFEELENELHQSITVNRTTKQQRQKRQRGEIIKPNDSANEAKANEKLQTIKKSEESNMKRQYYVDNIYDDTIGFLNNLDTNLLNDQDGEPIEDMLQVEEDKGAKQNGHATKVENSNDDGREQKREITSSTSFTPTNDEENNEPNFGGGLADTLKFLQSKNLMQSDNNSEKFKIVPTNDTSSSSNFKYIEKLSQKSELLKLKTEIEERVLKEELEKDKQYKNLSKVEKEKYFEEKLDERLKNKNIINEENQQPERNGNRFKNRKIGNSNNNNRGKNEFESYNPKVELNYKDDNGKVLNTKQAYKHLSHKYHGN
ncbi:hypothetical protein KGF54_000960 [Candida jiufengensis]|uniref:uncharacterized protein n=1 Tax=Candida jiufengensis TaxID=497108 RepID=UPI0022250E88|nr:uncharacterized protein KGF54_000960 [Candida jiufengensis]KAI5956485.1 hypothetical protein KGF54_000960 [Candida jiufengensis]